MDHGELSAAVLATVVREEAFQVKRVNVELDDCRLCGMERSGIFVVYDGPQYLDCPLGHQTVFRVSKV